MNKVIKNFDNFKGTIYFTSDLHLNHDRPFIYEPRGYSDIVSHTNDIIDIINSVVKPTDILFNLGDFCLNTDENEFDVLLSRIKCENIYTLFGNHNNPLWKIYQKEIKEWLRNNDEGYNTSNNGTPYVFDDGEIEIYPFKYRNMIFIGNYSEIMIHGHFIVLSHYPMLSWNKMKKGAWHLFGHVHNELNLDGKRIDVGWNTFKKPVSFQELQKLMSYREIISDGGHH